MPYVNLTAWGLASLSCHPTTSSLPQPCLSPNRTWLYISYSFFHSLVYCFLVCLSRLLPGQCNHTKILLQGCINNFRYGIFLHSNTDPAGANVTVHTITGQYPWKLEITEVDTATLVIFLFVFLFDLFV